MSIQNLLEKFKEIQSNLLTFFDNNEKEDIITFDDQQISRNSNEIKLFLRLILNICNNHHRSPNFFSKIEFILKQFREDILEYFSNSEIFDIFKNNKLILLFLIKEKILLIDKSIAKKFVTDKKYIDDQYYLYFAPEIKPFINEKWFRNKNIVEQLKEQLPADFEEKRMLGENDSYLSQLIRNDLIDHFIIHINQTNLPLGFKIENSKYETNDFFIRKCKFWTKTSLIEYAAFYGSIQIFNYLRLNNVKLESSLWIHAIHSNNPELIHLLEENKVEKNEKLNKKCFIEAIKCHHNNIVTYFEDTYSQSISSNLNEVLKYHNYEFIQYSFINKNAFLEFCKYDYYLFVQFLLENEPGIDINIQLPIKEKESFKNFKFAAIIYASKKNNIEIMKLLLSIPNIDVNIQTNFGFSALHYACMNSNFEITKLLLSMTNINVNIQNIHSLYNYPYKDKYEYTPLHFAIENDDIDIVKLLLSMPNIDINIQTSSVVHVDSIDRGFTPLHVACLHNRIEIIKLLLSMPNIDVNIQTSKSGKDGDGSYTKSYHEGFTALHFAANNDCIETAKLLLKMPKINVNIQTSSCRSSYDEFTPLHFAAANNNTEMVKLLLSNSNINVNLQTSLMGFTALHFACKNNNSEMVKLLLSMPYINLKIKSSSPDHFLWYRCMNPKYKDMTPLEIAIENKNFEIINIFAESKKIVVNIDVIKMIIERNEKNKKSNRERPHFYADFGNDDDEEEEEEEEGKK